MKRSLIVLALSAVAVAANATVYTFSHSLITIDPLGPAVTADFTVIGLDGPIVDVDIVLNGLSHTYPDDIGAVLANNLGNNVLLFDGPGDGTDISLTWRFDDSAAGMLPNTGPLVGGSFQPGQNQWSDVFTNVSGPYGATMAGLNAGGDGTWSLFVEDFVGGDGGEITSQDLIITTNPVPEPASLVALGVGVAALMRRRRSK